LDSAQIFLCRKLANSWDCFSFEAQTLVRPEHKEEGIILLLFTAFVIRSMDIRVWGVRLELGQLHFVARVS
jgi:hypothetical protein